MVPDHNVTTRRGFSKWLAAVGAVVAAPVAVQAAQSPPVYSADWDALETELRQKRSVALIEEEKREARHAAFTEWERRNPRPFDVSAEETKAWSRRWHTAHNQCFTTVTAAKFKRAYDEYLDVCKKVAAVPVNTLADIKAKSRIARLEHEAGPIHRAILKQFQNI